MIGDDNMWSFDNVIMDTDSHVILDSEGGLMNPNKEVVVGNHVWVGCRNTILKGSNIPNGCIIGSGSIITKNLGSPYSIYIGNKLLKEGVNWTRGRNVEGFDASKVIHMD